MSDKIFNIKIRASYETGDLEKATAAIANQKGVVSDLEKEFKQVNTAANKAHKEIQDESSKSTGKMAGLKGLVTDFTRDLNIFGVNAGQAFDKVNSGVGGTVKGMNLLKVAFAGLGIGLVIAAFASLVAYFRSTEKGAESLERFMSALSATFNVVTGRVARFGEGLFSILKGDFSGFERMKNAFDGIGKEMEDARNAALLYTTALQEIEDAEALLSVEVAKTRNEIQRLVIASKNRAISAQESTKLLLQAEKLEVGIINQQIALQEKKVAAYEKENAVKIKTKQLDEGNKTADLIKAEIDLANLRGNSLELLERIQNRLDLNATKSTTTKLKNVNLEVNAELNAAEEIVGLHEEKNKAIQDTDEARAQAYKGLNEELNEDQAKSLRDQLADYERFEGERQRLAKEAADKRKQIQQAAAQTSVAIINELFNFESQKNADQFNDLQSNKQRELSLAAGNKQAEATINKKFDAEERRMKREQAVRDKEQALFNIGIQTAQNAVKAYGTPPVPNFVLAGFAIALGGVQAGVVAARQIPKYNKGVKSVPGMDTGDDSVLSLLRPGEMVVPVETNNKYSPVLNAIFDHKIPAPLLNALAFNYNIPQTPGRKEDSRLLGEIQGMRKDLKNIKQTNLNIDKKGFKTWVSSGDSETEFINNNIVM